MLFIHSSVDGHLAIISNAEHSGTSSCLMYVFSPLGYITRIGIAGHVGNPTFNMLRNCQTVLQGGGIILHIHQQGMKGSSLSTSC